MKQIFTCLILLWTQCTFAQMKPANAGTVQNPSIGVAKLIEPQIDSTVIKAVTLPVISTGNAEEEFTDDTGCTRQHAIPQSDFLVLMRTITVAHTDDDRLLEAFRHARKSCLNSLQIAQICKSFKSEKTRLDFAKFAFSTCVDPKNYTKVAAVLTKKSNLDDLRWYITGK